MKTLNTLIRLAKFEVDEKRRAMKVLLEREDEILRAIAELDDHVRLEADAARHPHVQSFLDGSPDIGWIEVHSENYLSKGGPRLAALLDIRERYPVSCHGVGLSLGSAEGLDGDHLDRLADLFNMIQPGLVSEHVAWSVHDGVYMNDLLPLPYTEESLDVLCRNIDRAQTRFGRRILIENPSSYIAFAREGFSYFQELFRDWRV